MIEFKKAHIGYSNPPLITISDLVLNEGKVYILVGKNGSGKSTLLRTIIKQEKLLEGSILLDNLSINDIKNNAIAMFVAFVPTAFPRVDFLNVRDFVGLGRTPYTNALGRFSQEDDEIVDKAITTLGITHLKDKFTSELSDGERQLAAVAKAIAQETKIIILDEPTAFLDYSNKKKVLNILKDISTRMNKCIIISSHDIELSIEAECPFLVLKNDARQLIECHPPILKEELIALAF